MDTQTFRRARTSWPLHNRDTMAAFYGDPDPTNSGTPSPAWEEANLINIVPPYRMVTAWAPHSPIRTIRVHRNCAESLLRILNGIFDLYDRDQDKIEAARMHLFGGVYNFRLKRGGSTLSSHSWACSIDLDPERNGFGVPYDESRGMIPMAVVRIFEAEGWEWGGRWRRADAMHFQASRTGGVAASAKSAPDPLVRAVQEALIDHGYAETGDPDGLYGTMTRAGILAFEADNGLPTTGQVSHDLLATILATPKRSISEERSHGKPEGSRIVQSSEVIVGVGGATGATGLVKMAVDAVGEVEAGAETLSRIAGFVQPVLDVAGAYWPLLLIALGGFVAWQAWQARRARIEDHRTGRTR